MRLINFLIQEYKADVIVGFFISNMNKLKHLELKLERI